MTFDYGNGVVLLPPNKFVQKTKLKAAANGLPLDKSPINLHLYYIYKSNIADIFKKLNTPCMKKIVFACLISLLFSLYIKAQTLSPVLVEVFTETGCGACAENDSAFQAL